MPQGLRCPLSRAGMGGLGRLPTCVLQGPHIGTSRSPHRLALLRRASLPAVAAGWRGGLRAAGARCRQHRRQPTHAGRDPGHPRPVGTADDRYKHVDAAIAVIQASGLRYEVHGLAQWSRARPTRSGCCCRRCTRPRWRPAPSAPSASSRCPAAPRPVVPAWPIWCASSAPEAGAAPLPDLRSPPPDRLPPVCGPLLMKRVTWRGFRVRTAARHQLQAVAQLLPALAAQLHVDIAAVLALELQPCHRAQGQRLRQPRPARFRPMARPPRPAHAGAH